MKLNILIKCFLDYLQIVCQITSVLLHYFFLATYAWLMNEAFNLYIVITYSAHSHGELNESGGQFRYYFLGWGRYKGYCHIINKFNKCIRWLLDMWISTSMWHTGIINKEHLRLKCARCELPQFVMLKVLKLLNEWSIDEHRKLQQGFHEDELSSRAYYWYIKTQRCTL